MKILVGYNGGESGRMALLLARDFAKANDAVVYIMTSLQGGKSETKADVFKAEKNLDYAGKFMGKHELECKALQSVRSLSPGEDIVQFAKENNIDHIFLGIKKRSAAEKTILGSTSRYVILKAPCPVTTTKFDLKNINTKVLLKGRHILVVDDEPDILETAEELLDICHLDTAGSFDKARILIKNNQYDIVILDIMGVKGYELLELSRKKDIPALMLTAHALTPGNLMESIQKGADAYIPKDELPNLAAHVADVLKHRIKGKQGMGIWFSKMKPFFDKSFGKGWRDKEKAFWD
jgi:nucleotide-binding universal stress UspA family protein/CheY-like chemotaxis protein